MHSTFSRDDQSFISYNHPPLSMETSQTISLPFTYFQTSSIPSEERKTKTFDQIAAWLNHHDESPDLKYIDENRSSLSSQNIDDPGRKSIFSKDEIESDWPSYMMKRCSSMDPSRSWSESAQYCTEKRFHSLSRYVPMSSKGRERERKKRIGKERKKREGVKERMKQRRH